MNQVRNTMADNSDILADPSFRAEMMQTFIEEFEELMLLYKSSLQQLSSPHADRKTAFADLFRIYHTLKGDAGFFPEFRRFANFASYYCEILRPYEHTEFTDTELINNLKLNLSRLSSVLLAIKKGRSLEAFQFDRFFPQQDSNSVE